MKRKLVTCKFYCVRTDGTADVYKCDLHAVFASHCRESLSLPLSGLFIQKTRVIFIGRFLLDLAMFPQISHAGNVFLWSVLRIKFNIRGQLSSYLRAKEMHTIILVTIFDLLVIQIRVVEISFNDKFR